MSEVRKLKGMELYVNGGAGNDVDDLMAAMIAICIQCKVISTINLVNRCHHTKLQILFS